jgi:hypothetical protein
MDFSDAVSAAAKPKLGSDNIVPRRGDDAHHVRRIRSRGAGNFSCKQKLIMHHKI